MARTIAGRGEKSLHSDPGSELRLGREEKEKARRSGTNGGFFRLARFLFHLLRTGTYSKQAFQLQKFQLKILLSNSLSPKNTGSVLMANGSYQVLHSRSLTHAHTPGPSLALAMDHQHDRGRALQQ